MAKWTDRSFNSADGLRLHYRDYEGPHHRPPILCLPGLTRNARDFGAVADRFAGEWRILALDLRGRGESEYDPNPANYLPTTYAADVLKMLDQLGIADAVFLGTSLGGIVTMIIAGSDPERIAGALLNDVGPELDPAGIAWIGTYVGTDVRYANWAEAAEALAKRNGSKFPRWIQADWDRFARRICREDKGSIRFDYDMAIAENFRSAEKGPPGDAWPYFRALEGRPVTLLRGALSDLLSADVADQMKKELPGIDFVTIPDVGHAPSLDEPESMAAIERLLARVLDQEG